MNIPTTSAQAVMPQFVEARDIRSYARMLRRSKFLFLRVVATGVTAGQGNHKVYPTNYSASNGNLGEGDAQITHE
jgi:uncharacterized protein involved in exopolysaccharide biosynthesis